MLYDSATDIRAVRMNVCPKFLSSVLLQLTILALLLFGGLFGRAQAAPLPQDSHPAIPVSAAVAGQLTLGHYLHYLEDSSAALDIETLLSEPQVWSPSTDPTPSFGFTQSAYWFHVRLTNDQPADAFELPKVSGDVVTLGAAIYWDSDPGIATVTSTDNTLLGVAVAAAGNGAATVKVRLG